MKKIIVILFSILFLLVSCISVKKQIVPNKTLPVSKSATIDKEVNIKVRVKKDSRPLRDTVSSLNDIYGKPVVEISAFRSETGKIIVMKKLYYQIDKKTFIIVSVVNGWILLIDTVHTPVSDDKKEINKEKK